VPLGEQVERYHLTILDGSIVKRSVEVTAPTYLYTTATMLADFGAMPASFSVRLAQVSALVGDGISLERIIHV